eukprot:GHRR01003087.1.p1 GENE.GHRR01003087.1~~GHRR01003087.1.p1  ORF type:complete len:230 (+),score=78.33 GHRR01003087.1:1046-1735(+)
MERLHPYGPRGASASGGTKAGHMARSRAPHICRATVTRTSDAPALHRRALLTGTAALATSLLLPNPAAAKVASGDWTSSGLAAPENDSLPRFFKTVSGVKVQELSPGSGPAAQGGDAVLIDYVLRRSNGYFIYSTIEGVSFQPKDVPIGPVKLQLGSDQVIQGLQDALIGMQQGSKRRILVPPQLGYLSTALQPQPPTFATKRQLANHSSEPLLFEIQLLRVLLESKLT